ncbi:MAG: hypothetical protein AAB497_01660 [Patescibacteria group bacterium]
MNIKKEIKKGGAVLLIAIMVSSVVLAVGFGIYQRTYKQLLLGSFWRQIQIAFAAADAGLECAVYWDKKIPAGTSGTARCFEKDFTWSVTLPDDPSPAYVTALSSPGDSGGTGQLSVQGGCVEITIGKVYNPSPTATNPRKWTYIDVAGYNDACGSTNLRRVNRIRWVKYTGW